MIYSKTNTISKNKVNLSYKTIRRSLGGKMSENIF